MNIPVEPLARKTILLTGAAGQVGAVLRPLMREKYTVRLCDRVPLEPVADEQMVSGDLSSTEICERATQGVDGVVHLAGMVGPDLSFNETFKPNYRATLQLLEACRKAGVARFVFASSHHVVGLKVSSQQYGEDVAVAPDGFYGLSKAFGEAACSMYARRFGMRTLIIRLGNADAEVADGRRDRIWTGAADLSDLIDIGLHHPDLVCDTVYGLSICPDPAFSDNAARELGYRPKLRAVDHRSPTYKPLCDLPVEHSKLVGGFFGAATLPHPFGKRL